MPHQPLACCSPCQVSWDQHTTVELEVFHKICLGVLAQERVDLEEYQVARRQAIEDK